MAEQFKRRRAGILAGYIAYFAGILAALALLIRVGYYAALALAAVLVALYFALLRPAGRRYCAGVVTTTLANTVGARLSGFTYAPKGGLDAGAVADAGLPDTQADRAFRSWHYITGRQGGLGVELADVSFAIRDKGLNAMFSGCCVRIRGEGIRALGVLSQAGRVPEGTPLPGWQNTLLEEINRVRPTSLYLKVGEGTVSALLRYRFLGFKASPMLPVTDQTLSADPLPELEGLLKLAQRLDREGRARA